MLNNPAYNIIKTVYGNWCAKRSAVPLINHIDEGLFILDCYEADIDTKSAYAIHPIVQVEDSNSSNFKKIYELDSNILTLAVEYARIANSWLCGMPKPDKPLSPFKQVNLMLIADKVQNRKDFELYHKNTHNNSIELDKYFKNWLAELGVSEESYQMLVDKIKIKFQ